MSETPLNRDSLALRCFLNVGDSALINRDVGWQAVVDPRMGKQRHGDGRFTTKHFDSISPREGGSTAANVPLCGRGDRSADFRGFGFNDHGCVRAESRHTSRHAGNVYTPVILPLTGLSFCCDIYIIVLK